MYNSPVSGRLAAGVCIQTSVQARETEEGSDEAEQHAPEHIEGPQHLPSETDAACLEAMYDALYLHICDRGTEG